MVALALTSGNASPSAEEAKGNSKLRRRREGLMTPIGRPATRGERQRAREWRWVLTEEGDGIDVHLRCDQRCMRGGVRQETSSLGKRRWW